MVASWLVARLPGGEVTGYRYHTKYIEAHNLAWNKPFKGEKYDKWMAGEAHSTPAANMHIPPKRKIVQWMLTA